MFITKASLKPLQRMEQFKKCDPYMVNEKPNPPAMLG